MQSVRCAADHDAQARHHTYCILSKGSCNGVCRATITACKSITGESTCDLLGKNSKLRLVAMNQQYYCNGRETRNLINASAARRTKYRRRRRRRRADTHFSAAAW
jgi:hypothetical protein